VPPPPENEGFLRADASLFVIFVSDEEEGAKEDGASLHYYERLFEGLKGRGNEAKVSMSAIVGWPIEEGTPTIDQVCPILATSFNGNPDDDDPRVGAVRTAMAGGTGCVHQPDPAEDPVTVAETGGRYVELACRTGGVATNLCDESYTAALDTLGANAAGLRRRYVLSKHREIDDTAELDSDCVLYTNDDTMKIDCNEDGDEEDEIDGPICVKAVPFGSSSGQVLAIPRSQTGGWTYDATTGALIFAGGFLPAPNTDVTVSYMLYERDDRCRPEAEAE
jgi:hypothetical protein